MLFEVSIRLRHKVFVLLSKVGSWFSQFEDLFLLCSHQSQCLSRAGTVILRDHHRLYPAGRLQHLEAPVQHSPQLRTMIISTKICWAMAPCAGTGPASEICWAMAAHHHPTVLQDLRIVLQIVLRVVLLLLFFLIAKLSLRCCRHPVKQATMQMPLRGVGDSSLQSITVSAEEIVCLGHARGISSGTVTAEPLLRRIRVWLTPFCSGTTFTGKCCHLRASRGT